MMARPRWDDGLPPLADFDVTPPDDDGWQADEPVRLPTARVASWRTLADIDDAPPEPLLLGMLEHGPNLMYATGGTGKGTTGAWMVRELLAEGVRPLVYDAENRPREWARRTSGLGVDRSQVIYLQPKDLPGRLVGRPLWEVAEHLGEIAHRTEAGILFVDSILPAIGIGEERLKSDAQAPYLYVAALDSLAIPSVSFGHPPKGQPAGEPFGSVAWTAAMRMTWNGTLGESSGHRVRWRPRKRNERGRIPGVLLTFSYDEAGRLCGAERQDDDEATREWLLGALLDRSATIAQLADLLTDELDEAQNGDERRRTEERIGRTLRRMARAGDVRKDGRDGRADRWALDVVVRP